MSRAFVSESEWSEEVDLPALKSPLPPGTRNYMTAWGAEKLKAEIDQLTHIERPRAVATVAHERETAGEAIRGGLTTAQHDLAMLDRRLAYLGDLMRLAEVVNPPAGPAERVTFGATVRVTDRADGSEETFRIVGVYESDPENGSISWISPMAKALKGRAVGDVVEVALPAGARRLEVTAIRYE